MNILNNTLKLLGLADGEIDMGYTKWLKVYLVCLFVPYLVGYQIGKVIYYLK